MPVLKIKKQVPQAPVEVDVEIYLPAYRKNAVNNQGYFYKVESEVDYLQATNWDYEKQLRVITGNGAAIPGILDYELSTEEEFESAKNDVLVQIKDAFDSPVTSKIFSRNRYINNAVNEM